MNEINDVINVSLVRELVASQFPDWAQLPIERVEPNGWDNRTFRLGSEMSVRLPSHQRYAAQVEKEQEWLPRLGPLLPLAVPTPLARGVPDHGYPWHWSVYGWLDGDTAGVGQIDDLNAFASELARFLRALHQIDPTGGPAPGLHNFFRGGSLDVYDAEVRDAIKALEGQVDSDSVTDVWEAALEASWHGDPVWIHGDLAASNLLVRDGGLSAVIDFGCSGVGDPSCDLVIAWTFLSGPSREAFRSGLSLDEGAWARARGWALWKAITNEVWRVVDEVVAEHEAEA